MGGQAKSGTPWRTCSTAAAHALACGTRSPGQARRQPARRAHLQRAQHAQRVAPRGRRLEAEPRAAAGAVRRGQALHVEGRDAPAARAALAPIHLHVSIGVGVGVTRRHLAAPRRSLGRRVQLGRQLGQQEGVAAVAQRLRRLWRAGWRGRGVQGEGSALSTS